MPSSIFDVKTFGALGDGMTYDDLAFQHALEAINAFSPASESRGAILHIPFGTYRLRQTLHITRHTKLHPVIE